MTLLGKKTDRPRLDDDPQYRAAQDKLQDLRGRAAKLDEAINTTNAKLATEHREDELTQRATVLLERGELPAQRDPLRGLYEDLRSELLVVRHAVAMQTKILERETTRASHEICVRLRDRHGAIIKRVAAALRELGVAVSEERAFREDLVSEGIIFTGELRPMPFSEGDLTEAYSAASRWLRDAEEHKLL